mgnify:CR=1 FL=1
MPDGVKVIEKIVELYPEEITRKTWDGQLPNELGNDKIILRLLTVPK